jgi:hypothetical protein
MTAMFLVTFDSRIEPFERRHQEVGDGFRLTDLHQLAPSLGLPEHERQSSPAML